MRSEITQSQPSATPSAGTKSLRQRESEAEGADSTPRQAARARVAAAPESKPEPASAPPVAAAIAKPDSAVAGAIQGYVDLPPEKWLERIADLRKQGRIEEAKASFTAFRKRYPEYPLPAMLKDWTSP